MTIIISHVLPLFSKKKLPYDHKDLLEMFPGIVSGHALKFKQGSRYNWKVLYLAQCKFYLSLIYFTMMNIPVNFRLRDLKDYFDATWKLLCYTKTFLVIYSQRLIPVDTSLMENFCHFWNSRKFLSTNNFSEVRMTYSTPKVSNIDEPLNKYWLWKHFWWF